MAESENTGSLEALHFLKNLDIVPFSKVEAAQLNLNSENLDIHVLASVANKLSRICQKQNILCIHSIFAGLPIPLFVVFEEHFFRFFYDCEYEPLSEQKSFIENSFYNSKSEYKKSEFISKRYEKIRLFGQELIVGPATHFKKIDDTFDVPYSVVIQQMIECQKGNFLFKTSIEVERQ